MLDLVYLLFVGSTHFLSGLTQVYLLQHKHQKLDCKNIESEKYTLPTFYIVYFLRRTDDEWEENFELCITPMIL